MAKQEFPEEIGLSKRSAAIYVDIILKKTAGEGSFQWGSIGGVIGDGVSFKASLTFETWAPHALKLWAFFNLDNM